jgi:aspartyl-tRNA(Asn)/glutamyl-tRNA(Gln) amidotransferase subunit A
MNSSGSDELSLLSAQDLAALVRARKVSPVEVLQSVLSRIERHEPRINALVVLDREGALRAARQAEDAVIKGGPLGPLHGVPVTIKDVQAVAGLPTRRGSRLTNAAPAAADAPAVARLRAAGAVILGKTTTTEHGWTAVSDSPLTGATRNPWRHGLTAGGSSSGAAALAASGCGPLHLGTDGAGSVRLPAHFCGVIGFKPTFGMVPYSPVPNNGSLSHIGPITRTVADAEKMLAAVAGPHPSDHTTLPGRFEPFVGSVDRLGGVRIAFSPDLGHVRVDGEVADLVASAVKTFETVGAFVEEVRPPWGPIGPELIRALWGAPLLGFLPINPQDEAAMDPGLIACLRDSQGLGVRDVLAAQARRLSYAADVGDWFASGWDLLITPSASVTAFSLGRQRPEHWPQHSWDWLAWAEFSYPFNLAHGPAISVPCGLTAKGLPVGLQIAGPRNGDALVLRSARSFLTARPFRPLASAEA